MALCFFSFFLAQPLDYQSFHAYTPPKLCENTALSVLQVFGKPEEIRPGKHSTIGVQPASPLKMEGWPLL